MKDKKYNELMVDLLSTDELDTSNLEVEGLQAEVLKNNPYFLKAVAELSYSFMLKEDNITADTSLSFEDKAQYRTQFSLSRLILQSLVNTLDAKIMLLENQGTINN